MEYLVVIEQKYGLGDIDVKECATKEEAFDLAEYIWSHKTASEQKRDKVTVIKSINPIEDAENHLDGKILKGWL